MNEDSIPTYVPEKLDGSLTPLPLPPSHAHPVPTPPAPTPSTSFPAPEDHEGAIVEWTPRQPVTIYRNGRKFVQPVDLTQPPDDRRCTAISRRTGKRCTNWAMRGREKCRFHGGKAPIGIASPAFKHGRYSKNMPAKLVDKYKEIAEDEDLLSMRDEMALLTMRIGDLISRVDTGEAGKHWRNARIAYGKIKMAMDTGNAKNLATGMVELEETIRAGLQDYAVWEDIQNTIDLRRRVSESERKRLVDMQQMITADKAVVFVSAIIDVVRRNVTDRNTLQNISEELESILNHQ